MNELVEMLRSEELLRRELMVEEGSLGSENNLANTLITAEMIVRVD